MIRDAEQENLRLMLENQFLRAELDRFRSLAEGYPDLPATLRVLAWIWLDAYPLKAPVDELGTRIRGTGSPSPGAGTHRERARYERFGRRLKSIRRDGEVELGDGDDSQSGQGIRPRCYAPDTGHRGLRLKTDAEFCHKCGHAVTTKIGQ